MIQTIIFDLSEVLIAGWVGIEKPLAAQLNRSEHAVLPAFAGSLLDDLCRGNISEDCYLERIIAAQQWSISTGTLKRAIRENFQRRVPGMDSLTARLAARYELVLLSDYAAEWIDYIYLAHPLLNQFRYRFFSFELKQTKREPSTFQTVLNAIGREPRQCLFIDDSATNVSVAQSVGIAGIVFTSATDLGSRVW